MKRRGFIAAALALIPGLALFKLKPAPGADIFGTDGRIDIYQGFQHVKADDHNSSCNGAYPGTPCLDDCPQYGRGPGFEALHDVEYLPIDRQQYEILMGFEDSITGTSKTASRDFDNMLERFRRKQGLS